MTPQKEEAWWNRIFTDRGVPVDDRLRELGELTVSAASSTEYAERAMDLLAQHMKKLPLGLTPEEKAQREEEMTTDLQEILDDLKSRA